MDKRRMLGAMCRNFRIDVLGKTLKEVEGSEDVKLLSAFEHGRSTNYKHFFKYFEACDNEDQEQILIDKLKFVAKAYY